MEERKWRGSRISSPFSVCGEEEEEKRRCNARRRSIRLPLFYSNASLMLKEMLVLLVFFLSLSLLHLIRFVFFMLMLLLL